MTDPSSNALHREPAARRPSEQPPVGPPPVGPPPAAPQPLDPQAHDAPALDPQSVDGCASGDGDTSRRPIWLRRTVLGPWVASIWLIFLLPALADGWKLRDEPRGIVGMLTILAFMVVYAGNFLAIRASRMKFFIQPNLRHGIGYVLLLAVLGVLATISVGTNGLATFVYVAVSAILLLPLVAAIPVVVVLVVAGPVWAHLASWPGGGGVALGTILGSFAVLGMRSAATRNIQLLQAHEQNTLLAVDNERNRFARDLHDILGHSLTVITVKAELARRLIDADPTRAKAEIADLERLSRDALADVRRAVQGYRELTLPGELARARIALQAAEIESALPQSTDVVPTQLRELFAWTVREGVTNVIRHSGARRCEIVLTASGATVRDDGSGPGGTPEGTGLIGLRERAAAAGAKVVTRPLEPGFALEVTT